jgi:myo-inositol-1(or 4)-monophosphatase
MRSYTEDLTLATQTAPKVWEEIIKPYYDSQNFNVENKQDNSPVTQADKEADQFLKKNLLYETQGYGWLSEEIEDDPSRFGKKRIWIVDPIDGTRSFIRKGNRFTISIGLAEQDDNGDYHPVVGVIYAPVLNRLFTVAKGHGFYINGEKITRPTNTKPLVDQLCMISLTEQKKGLMDPFDGKFQMDNNPSLAHKLALVAAGEADMMLTVKPKSEWDTAAGHAMCNEMGIELTDLEGNPVTYNHSTPQMNGLIVATPQVHTELSSLLTLNR